jgi:hypothetical protein
MDLALEQCADRPTANGRVFRVAAPGASKRVGHRPAGHPGDRFTSRFHHVSVDR